VRAEPLAGRRVLVTRPAERAAGLVERIERARGVALRFPVIEIEPLARADAPRADWARLAEQGHVPLAAGENVAGLAEFDRIIEERAVAFIQPDTAKWGGITGCSAVARKVLAAGLTYCPHYLGGGVGLLASAHLLAAAGGSGLLEIDYNENPLRQDVWSPSIEGGRTMLPDAPGLGIEEIPDSLVWRATYCRDLRPDGSS